LGLRISGALHLGIFEQPEKNQLFSSLFEKAAERRHLLHFPCFRPGGDFA
jgi:hypothetical protein